MSKNRFFAALVAITGLFTLPAAAAESEVYTSKFSDLAVGGYDPVAYFESGAPAQGDKKFSYEYDGATWLFASGENLEKFKSAPGSFAPQYGGYCAWAVSQGYTAPGNPKYWSIEDGKLYLNYNAKVQADWLKDPAGFIAKADANWPAVLSK